MKKRIVSETYAYNPHELVRLLEVFDILTVSEYYSEFMPEEKIKFKSPLF